MNPLGKVPVLFHNNNIIYESLVTCEYIDEVFPGDYSIHADNASERARDRMMVELFNKVIMPQMRLKRYPVSRVNVTSLIIVESCLVGEKE